MLTKRPENFARFLPEDWGEGYAHVWLGVRAEDQENADRRIPILAATPARMRFVSVEPMLGPVDLRPHLPRVDWVIVGGESVSLAEARRMDPEWARDVIGQCRAAGVPVFVKQMGTVLAREWGLKNKKGEDPAEWPEDLRVQEMPPHGGKVFDGNE